jgi:hypothetical protein
MLDDLAKDHCGGALAKELKLEKVNQLTSNLAKGSAISHCC